MKKSSLDNSLLPQLCLLLCITLVSFGVDAHTAPKRHKHVHGVYHFPGYKARGVVVAALPAAHVRQIIKGRPYYYHRGIFYRPNAKGFVVINAPLGARLRHLPTAHRVFVVAGRRYYHLGDTYYVYDATHGDYVVVAAPEPAVVVAADQAEARR